MKESLSDTYFIRPEHPMNAYSRLKRLLQQHRLSVPELQRRMQRQGFHVNVKSLYRLSDDLHPVDRLDMRVAGAICQVCEVSLSEWIVFEETTEALQTLSPEAQNRLEVLMSKNNEGLLTASEHEELGVRVREAEEITLTNARLLARQHGRLSQVPSEASRAS